MSMRACLGLVTALMVAFAATPAFAVYTGVAISGGNAQQIASMTITLPGQRPVPVQQSKTDDERKLGAYFIDTPEPPKAGDTAIVGFTSLNGRHETIPVQLGDSGFVIDLPPAASATPGPSSEGEATNSTESGTGPRVWVRVYGGDSFNSYGSAGAAGVDLAALFPVNRGPVSFGPTLGTTWVNTSLVAKTGGGPPPSTFSKVFVSSDDWNFGARLQYKIASIAHHDWFFSLDGGVTVASLEITQKSGVCVGTGGSLPPGCTVFGAANSRATVNGPYVGVSVSYGIFSDADVFAEYAYSDLRDKPAYFFSGSTTGGSSGPNFNVGGSEFMLGVAFH